MKALVVDVSSGSMFSDALQRLTPVEVKVLMALLSNMNEDRLIHHTSSSIAEAYGVSRQSVSRSTSRLACLGIIKKCDDGMWRYEVNKEIGTRVTANIPKDIEA